MYMDFILLDGVQIKVFDVYGFYSFRWGGYNNLKSKYIWILNFQIKKSRYKNLKSKYTWFLNFYIQIFPSKNLKSIYNIFSSILSFPLLFLFFHSKYQPLEAPYKIKSLLFFIIWIFSSKIGQHHSICIQVGQWEGFAGVDILFVRVSKR